MGVSAILKFATASLSDMISRKSTYTPYCRSFSWFYEFILRKWRHFRIPIWRKRTVSVISSHSEEPVAHFNIANLNKRAEIFFARPQFASYRSKICTDYSLL